jgi:hypothetical protein
MNMLEQELASIIHTVLDKAGDVTPYYHQQAKDFQIPSIFFPVPEKFSGSFSLSSYEISFLWLIKVYATDTMSAYEIASNVLEDIVSHRNLIPLYNMDGSLTGKSLRVKFPRLRKVEEGIVQLQIEWDSIRGYHQDPAEKMTTFKAAYNGTILADHDVGIALQIAIDKYLVDYRPASTNVHAGEMQI